MRSYIAICDIGIVKRIGFTSASAKQMRKLPVDVAGQVRAKLHDYARDGTGDVTPMKGQAHGFRLRVRDWRVVFLDRDGEVTVVAIGHRREVYR